MAIFGLAVEGTRSSATSHLQAAVVGGLLFSLFVLAWTGVWRSWIFSWGLYGSITIFPGMGLLLLAYAADPLLPSGLSSALGVIALVASVMGYVLFMWRPRWFGPSWLKRMAEDVRNGYVPRKD